MEPQSPPIRLDQNRRTDPGKSQPSNNFKLAPLAVAIWEVYTGGAAEFATESLYSEDSNDGDLSSARNLVREQWSTIRSNSLLPDLGFGEEPLEWRPP